MNQFNKVAKNYKETLQAANSFIPVDVENYAIIKALHINSFLKKNFNHQKIKVLDIGCGIGSITKYLTKQNVEVYGIDTSTASIELAQQNLPHITFLSYDGNEIPFEDNSFDFVFCSNVLHHIDVEKRDAFLSTAMKKVKFRGYLGIIEHNPYNPLTRKSVSNCSFDDGCILEKRNTLEKRFEQLGYKYFGRYILFTPFVSALFFKIDCLLKYIPLGAQYFICVPQNEVAINSEIDRN